MTMDLNLAQTAEALSSPNQQLNLPTGPFTVVRPRRERTDEDREWYSKQLAVPHEKRIDKLVFERMAFYGSLNPERTAYPAVKRLAREALCSERSVRYALRRLESSGLIECIFNGCGRLTSQYRVVGSKACRSDLQSVQVRPANAAPNVLKEGKKRSSKDLAFTDNAKTIDPDEKEVNPSLFPSQEKARAKAPVKPIAFAVPKVIALWYALMRKLGRPCNDTLAGQLDRLPHRDKVRIIDDLAAEERELVHKGLATPAPIKKPKTTGYLPPKAVAAADEAMYRATCQHEPSPDLPINCAKCGSYIGQGVD